MSVTIWAACGFFVAIGGLSAGQFQYQLYSNPSLFVTGMAESKDGTLWIAAHEGLYRFDGLHFENLTLPRATSVSDVDVTIDQTVWVSTQEGLLRYRGGFETVFPGPVNQTATIGNVLLFRQRYGTWEMTASGSAIQPRGCGADFFYGHILVGAHQSFQLVCRDNPTGSIGEIAPDIGEEPTIARVPGNWNRVVTDRLQNTWLEAHPASKLYRLRPNTAHPVPFSMPRYDQLYQNRLVSDDGGSAWFLGNPTVNLTWGYSLDRGRDFPRITQLATGLGKSVWVAERGVGLVRYRVGETWERWTSQEIGASDFGLAARQPGQPPLIFSNSGLMVPNQGNIVPVGTSALRIRHLAPLADGSFVGIVPKVGVVIVDSLGQITYRAPPPEAPKPRSNWQDVCQLAKADGAGRVWIAGPALLELIQTDGRWRLIQVDLPKQHDELAVEDVQVDGHGTPWVGYAEGIAYLGDRARWTQVETDKPLRDVASLELHGDDIWVAHSAPGRYARLQRHGRTWSVEEFSDSEGGVNRSYWIRIDSRGWIWRAVDDGVRISDGRDLQNWLYLSARNGLDVGTPSRTGFHEDLDGSVWIAGTTGIAHFRPKADWFEIPHDSPPPVISRVVVDGRRLAAQIGGLAMPVFRFAPLQYRLLPSFDSWHSTANGNLEFFDLKAGAYTLEVRYAGVGASPVVRRKLWIGVAPGRSRWISLLGGMGILALGMWIFRSTPLYSQIMYRLRKSAHLARSRLANRITAPRREIVPGQRVDGRYSIVRLIATGGFSRVYEARDTRSDLRVAVKVMDVEPRAQGWIRDRFSHEQNSLRAVQHPNVVRLLHGGVCPDGALYLVMPFLEGNTLRQRLREGPVPPSEALSILRQMARALDTVHAAGIVHLDFKPENVILTPRGPCLIDFGTSGLRGGEGELAFTTVLSGSPVYMAPERLVGRYSPASDGFSFGLVCQELLTGKLLSDYAVPYFEAGFNEEFSEILHAVAGANDRKLAECLAKAFDTNPANRPTSLADWVEEWAQLLRPLDL